jgi:hypothetical protein
MIPNKECYVIKLPIYYDEDIDSYVLDQQDAFAVLNENNKGEADLIDYIDHYCDYLNYDFYHSETANGNIEKEYLTGWICGFNRAKHCSIIEEDNQVYIKIGNYRIVFSKPYRGQRGE